MATSETNPSLLFRPVFKKKEERKRVQQLPKKNAKPSAIRPSSSGVKLVFDFDDDANQGTLMVKKNVKTSKVESARSESEDEWIEAPQQVIHRPKASDLI